MPRHAVSIPATMRHLSRLLFFLGVAASPLFLTSCGTMLSNSSSSSKNYHVVAHRPHDPSKVEVFPSLKTQNFYVMEGDRLLMAAVTNVGKQGDATPIGDFTIYNKEKHRRRQSE